MVFCFLFFPFSRLHLLTSTRFLLRRPRTQPRPPCIMNMRKKENRRIELMSSSKNDEKKVRERKKKKLEAREKNKTKLAFFFSLSLTPTPKGTKTKKHSRGPCVLSLSLFLSLSTPRCAKQENKQERKKNKRKTLRFHSVNHFGVRVFRAQLRFEGFEVRPRLRTPTFRTP